MYEWMYACVSRGLSKSTCFARYYFCTMVQWEYNTIVSVHLSAKFCRFSPVSLVPFSLYYLEKKGKMVTDRGEKGNLAGNFILSVWRERNTIYCNEKLVQRNTVFLIRTNVPTSQRYTRGVSPPPPGVEYLRATHALMDTHYNGLRELINTNACDTFDANTLELRRNEATSLHAQPVEITSIRGEACTPWPARNWPTYVHSMCSRQRGEPLVDEGEKKGTSAKENTVRTEQMNAFHRLVTRTFCLINYLLVP